MQFMDDNEYILAVSSEEIIAVQMKSRNPL